MVNHIIVVGAVAAIASAAPQDQIDAAFALQADGATLTQVRAALAPHAGDAGVDFAIGMTDFLLATEGLIQDAYRHGFLSTFMAPASMIGAQGGFIEWIYNDDAAPTLAKDVHDAIAQWTDALARADASLGAVGADFTCTIDVSAIRFDINADAAADEAESVGTLLGLLPERFQVDEDGNWNRVPMIDGPLVVDLDRGDGPWLRAYCNVLMGVGEWMLAHDGQELFDHTGHVFFPNAKIKYDFLPNSTWSIEKLSGGAMETPAPFDLTDLITFFANMRLPVDEPDRMRAALEHFRTAVDHAREMWTHYDAETDDAREWVPNPRQTAAIADVAIDEEMRAAWLIFLDEADAVLGGEKVLRFWRGDGTKGIDVPKVFTEPREFDLIYWVQGSGAAPYLREGEFTTPETWRRLLEVFDNRVFRYMFWVN